MSDENQIIHVPKINKVVDKTANVLVVESNVSLRTMYSNALKALGFAKIHTSNDINLATGILESEDIDWVISTLQTENKINIYHLLNMCTKYEALKEVLVTVPLQEQDRKHIPHLAELGAMSWFTTKSVEDHIKAALGEILKGIQQNRNDPVLVATDYLEEYLKDKQKFKELIGVYRNILKLYPGSAKLLLKMAEAQLLAGEKKEGSLTLQQACTMSPDTKDDAQKIADQYLGGVLPSISSGSTSQNPFGIKECVLCKMDGNSKSVIEELLTETNVPFKYFSNAESCLDYAELDEEPTLVICGWWNNGLNTAAFLQRLRQSCPHTLIATITRTPDSAELALLEEINCALMIKPPVIKESMLEKLVWTIQQDRRPLEKSFLISKVHQALADGQIDQAIQYKENLEKNELATKGDIHLVSSEILFAQSKFDGSLALAIDALKYGADSVASLNAIGKSFMKLGKFEKAFQAFDQAQELSPLNVKRLCVMAEAQFELGNDAEDFLKEASLIDDGSPQINETKAKASISEGNVEIGKDLLSKLNNIKDIIAYLNNKAVSAALKQNFDEAISLYQQAVDSVPDQHSRYRTIINYNLGILHLRMGNMDDAEKVLRLCLPDEDILVAEKAEQLVTNIEQARARNKQLKMKEKEAPPSFQLNEDDLKKIKRGIRLAKKETIINRGERCLYLLYHPESKLKIVTESLVTIPSYKAKKEVELENKKLFV